MGSIQLVQLSGKSGEWQAMKNTWGAEWEIVNQPEGPLNIRVKDSNGAEVQAICKPNPTLCVCMIRNFHVTGQNS